jgi:hypothetical protein
MSELKTNKISTNDQNNVAIDNALGLKSYDTTARDALTSVAGDMIYNTTEAVPQYYDGSSWTSMKTFLDLDVDALLVAGGDGQLNPAGEGGGANGVTYTSGSHPAHATANTGGGGGGGASRAYNRNGSSGGSGVIILRYPNGYSISFGAGVTGTESATGSDKYAVITAGTGTVSWS